jgi:predicted enzyme related to lactoylglutathione lyase
MTTEFAPGTPNWVDLGTTDVAAARGFYTNLFGWTVEDLGPEAGGYLMLRKDGKQVAGMGPATDPSRGTSWALYFATDNADEAAAKVESHGGKVVLPPMDVMGQGRMAVFQDPAGAYFSVWQPGAHRGAELVDQHGSLTWAELLTPDIAEAKSFYQGVLGVSTRDVDMGEGGAYTLLQAGGASVAGAMPLGADQSGMPPHWLIYFAVDDCDRVADRAVQLGATEVVRQDSPAGRFAMLVDPQGGEFSIITNNPDFSI